MAGTTLRSRDFIQVLLIIQNQLYAIHTVLAIQAVIQVGINNAVLAVRTFEGVRRSASLRSKSQERKGLGMRQLCLAFAKVKGLRHAFRRSLFCLAG